MKRVVSIMIMALFMPVAGAAVEHPWLIKKDKEGIQVHVRPVEGSAFLEYKGRVVLEHSLGKVIAFYEQEKRMPDWFHQCVESRLLEQITPDEKVLYFAIDLPWPVSDRDSVYRRLRTTDPATGAVEYRITMIPEGYPRQDGRIRMPKADGLWRFTPLDGGKKTEAYYQQHGNAGGHIPALLVNQLAVNIPFESLKHLRREMDAGV